MMTNTSSELDSSTREPAAADYVSGELFDRVARASADDMEVMIAEVLENGDATSLRPVLDSVLRRLASSLAKDSVDEFAELGFRIDQAFRRSRRARDARAESSDLTEAQSDWQRSIGQ